MGITDISPRRHSHGSRGKLIPSLLPYMSNKHIVHTVQWWVKETAMKLDSNRYDYSPVML